MCHKERIGEHELDICGLVNTVSEPKKKQRFLNVVMCSTWDTSLCFIKHSGLSFYHLPDALMICREHVISTGTH